MDSDEVSGDGPVLQAIDIVKHFERHGGASTRAVDGVSFELEKGKTLGIVGESGSGKSTLARTLLRLVEPTSGEIRFRGRDVTKMKAAEMRGLRRHIQMIFQDPYASLHPRRRVSRIISEPWRVHRGVVARAAQEERIDELLALVGLPGHYRDLFPGRLSGGERQRVAIARALALEPDLLVLDEPVSALDVSVQAQVVSLLMRLQQDLGLTYVFISHDLALVRLVADNVGVMYGGRLVEYGRTADIYARPAHPYTQLLLDSSPSFEGANPELAMRAAIAPTSIDGPPSGGCGFRNRCPLASPICEQEDPVLTLRPGSHHPVACHNADLARVRPAENRPTAFAPGH
jgi:oligopeptide/dipeptide ABC transporter ATP-binding protein